MTIVIYSRCTSSTTNQDMELKMSASLPATNLSPAPIGDAAATRRAPWRSPLRHGVLGLAAAAALAVAACAGGAGLSLEPVHSASGNYCVDEAQNLLQRNFGPSAKITKARQIDSNGTPAGTWKMQATTNLCTDYFIFTSVGMGKCMMPAYGSAPAVSVMMAAHGDCANLPADGARADLPAADNRQ
jgi:hypothetical protein